MSTQSAINVHIGARIRKARQAQPISQTALGDALGVTFQQIQKYESGRNRIAASQLFVVADFLLVELDYFFAGLPKQIGRGARAKS